MEIVLRRRSFVFKTIQTNSLEKYERLRDSAAGGRRNGCSKCGIATVVGLGLDAIMGLSCSVVLIKIV